MDLRTHHFDLSDTTCHAHIKFAEQISVGLPENATSGYRWQLAPHMRLPGLKLIEQEFKKEDNRSVGMRNFVFEATGELTQTSLQFRLNHPSGYTSSTLQCFDLDVNIEL